MLRRLSILFTTLALVVAAPAGAVIYQGDKSNVKYERTVLVPVNKASFNEPKEHAYLYAVYCGVPEAGERICQLEFDYKGKAACVGAFYQNNGEIDQTIQPWEVNCKGAPKIPTKTTSTGSTSPLAA